MEEDIFEISSVELQDFSDSGGKSKAIIKEDIERLAELQLDVRALLGSREVTIKEVNDYEVGDIIKVDRIEGHSVDVFVGSEKVAVGEVVIMEDKFALVISDAFSRKGDFLKKVRKNGEVG